MTRTSKNYTSVFSLLFLFFLCVNFLFLFLGMKYGINFSNSNNQITSASFDVNITFIMILPALLILFFSFSPFAAVTNVLLGFLVSGSLGFCSALYFLTVQKLTFEILAVSVVLAFYLISFVYLSYLSCRFSLMMILKDISLKFALVSGKACKFLLKFAPGFLLVALCSILIGCFY